MRKGFFDGLSETLTRTTKDLSKKAGQIYETQKIQSKVSSEEHMVEKLKCDIGNLVFSRYSGGVQMDEELQNLCQEIRQHMVAFCPFCGTACPNPEPKEEVAAEASAEEATETVAEDDTPGEEPAPETSEDVTDESAPEAETSSEDTQE